MLFVIAFEGHKEYEEEFNCVKIFETNSDPAAIEDSSWYCRARFRHRTTGLLPSLRGGGGSGVCRRRCQLWLAVEVHPAGVHSCQEQRHPHHDNAKPHGQENEEEVETVESNFYYSAAAFLSLDLENSNIKV